jgi:hypothetical protein
LLSISFARDRPDGYAASLKAAAVAGRSDRLR